MVAVWTLKVSAISLTDLPSFMSRRTKFVCSGLSFRGAPEVNPPPSSRLTAGTGAFPDQVAFELGDARKHGHDQLASVTSSVGPGFGHLQSSTEQSRSRGCARDRLARPKYRLAD